MRLLFVVQRYGPEVAGGAEAGCRELATRLAGRGHEVDVLTSRATSYVDWANAYPEGSTVEDGVTVHRLSVDHPRDPRFFGPLNGRVAWSSGHSPLFLQREWMRAQGPSLPALVPWLEANAAGFDVAVFVTYLYATTWAGLRVAAGLVPTVLMPAAHDEPPLWLELFDEMLRLPSAYAFLTEEEQLLVDRRARVRVPSAVVGLGVDLDTVGDEARFRASCAVGDRPYLLYVGRLDPGKGSDELYDHFTTYRARHPGPLALVVVGDPVKPLPPHPDVVTTGFVSDELKAGAIAGCEALVMPSYFESFSLVLVEAWAQRRPGLVNGRCDVLRGQARRSGGALPYRGYGEFEAAVEMLTGDAQLRRTLGERGRAYAESRYRWEDVLDHTEQLLRIAVTRHRRAQPRLVRHEVEA